MNVTFTNNGSVAVPLSSSNDKGFASMLEPGVPFNLNSADVVVINVGDNPSFMEEISTGLRSLFEKLAELVAFWRTNADTHSDDDTAISVTLQNHGPNALRVLLGSNVDEHQVEPGTSFEAAAEEYVEVRELGV